MMIDIKNNFKYYFKIQYNTPFYLYWMVTKQSNVILYCIFVFVFITYYYYIYYEVPTDY